MQAPAALCQKAPVCAASLSRHVFVCTGPACTEHGAAATLEAFYCALAACGRLYGKRGSPQGDILVTTCGSVGLCAMGPAVLVYPEGVWYYGVSPDDVDTIVTQHLLGGEPVTRLLARHLPRRTDAPAPEDLES